MITLLKYTYFEREIKNNLFSVAYIYYRLFARFFNSGPILAMKAPAPSRRGALNSVTTMVVISFQKKPYICCNATVLIPRCTEQMSRLVCRAESF
jgi:hypothetical protein